MPSVHTKSERLSRPKLVKRASTHSEKVVDPPGSLNKDTGETEEMPMPNDTRRIANIHDAAFTPFVYPDGVALGDAILQWTPTARWARGSMSIGCPPG